METATSARYPHTEAKAAAFRNRTVLMAPPGSTDSGAWRERPTRMLEGLDGFAPQPAPPLDRWGGRTDLPVRKATGFFRTEQIAGRVVDHTRRASVLERRNQRPEQAAFRPREPS